MIQNKTKQNKPLQCTMRNTVATQKSGISAHRASHAALHPEEKNTQPKKHTHTHKENYRALCETQWRRKSLHLCAPRFLHPEEKTTHPKKDTMRNTWQQKEILRKEDVRDVKE
jgi:hypothetical protein